MDTKKRVSKFEAHKEDILYLYHKGASLEIITQYLEQVQGVKRTKGRTALWSFIKKQIKKGE